MANAVAKQEKQDTVTGQLDELDKIADGLLSLSGTLYTQVVGPMPPTEVARQQQGPSSVQTKLQDLRAVLSDVGRILTNVRDGLG